jgi:xanthine/CO dehydrogenase XdhC/CoxF family maturation factor
VCELRALARHATHARARGQPLAVATIVDAAGSVYRRPGARMLVARDGAAHGVVSGGWLESELHERARLTLATGAPQVLAYDSAGEEPAFGDAPSVPGRVTVLLQRLPRARGNWLEFVRQRHDKRRTVAMATVFAAGTDGALAVGDCAVLDSVGVRHVRALPGQEAAALDAVLGDALRSGQTQVVRGFAGEGSAALVECLPPPVRLLVVGAGHDAGPVVEGARALGWEAIIVDPRPACLAPERFPEADLRLGEPEAALARFAGDARTAALVMTHDLGRDRRALAALAGVELAYLGVLGPGARTGRILAELEGAGIRLRAAERGRLYAPVGLALGAETPEEIAVAILAELVAHFRQGAVRSLRDRAEPIHPPVASRVREAPGTFERTG